jgi:hypothetical protein
MRRVEVRRGVYLPYYKVASRSSKRGGSSPSYVQCYMYLVLAVYKQVDTRILKHFDRVNNKTCLGFSIELGIDRALVVLLTTIRRGDCVQTSIT